MASIAVLTGAGISKESGLATFREAGGLWEGYDIKKVASIDGWHENPQMVLEFYNMRRQQAWEAEPNAAHIALAGLQEDHDVTIITQNVDNLHEKAGSEQVIHLHGSLFEAKSESDDSLIYEIENSPINLGDLADDGAQLRPNIVWFGEMVPALFNASEIIQQVDHFWVVGTSLQVYPAASLVDYYQGNFPIALVDPNATSIYMQQEVRVLSEPASFGVPTLISELGL